MCLLILGGTVDGRQLAEYFYHQGLPVIYSVAGLVRSPNVDCEVVSGGFTQFGGLENFIKQKAVAAILDATHPYAETMSTTAINIAKLCKIPCWRFHRQVWQQQDDDNWQIFNHWNELAQALAPFKRVLLTCGQVSREQLAQLSNYSQLQWLRTAVTPKIILPETVSWIKAIGPFALADEKALMQDHTIDVLVSKNSGGDTTSAKLQAARELTIPVFMLARPTLPNADLTFSSHVQCQDYVLNRFSHAV